MSTRGLFLGVALLVAQVAIAGAWGNVPVGTKLPPLALTSTTGKKVKVEAGDGNKALLLIYIRANHDRSTKALQAAAELHEKYGSKGLRILAVSTTRGDAAAVTKEARELKLPFPVLLDQKEEFYGRYGVFIHPATGVADAKGVLRYEYSSFRPDYPITVGRQVAAVLGLGPDPDQIVDVDRSATSTEELTSHRRDRMQDIARRKENQRAQRRLLASRALLDEADLELVLKLYRRWSETLPAPQKQPLADLAHKVTAGEAGAALAGLTALAGRSNGAAAVLWRARALIRLGRTAEAKQALEGCRGLTGAESGECRFELAALLLAKDRAAALAECRKAYEQIFGKD